MQKCTRVLQVTTEQIDLDELIQGLNSLNTRNNFKRIRLN
jgi:hypothetical protein